MELGGVFLKPGVSMGRAAVIFCKKYVLAHFCRMSRAMVHIFCRKVHQFYVHQTTPIYVGFRPLQFVYVRTRSGPPARAFSNVHGS